MDLPQFITKWSRIELTERSASQQHFLDLCDLVGHPKPAEVDPRGEWFTFERGVRKKTGGQGWADVWKRNHFAIEYKGRHRNLDDAYDQLLLYRGNLENPPLLTVCDMGRSRIHTNFTGTVEVVHDIPLEDLARPGKLDAVQWMFHEPAKLRPDVTREAVTIKVAGWIGRIAHDMQARGVLPMAAARFLDRVVFCLFAEDVGLLPNDLFSRTLEAAGGDPKELFDLLGELFRTMARGAASAPRRSSTSTATCSTGRRWSGSRPARSTGSARRPAWTGRRSTRRSSAPCSSGAWTRPAAPATSCT